MKSWAVTSGLGHTAKPSAVVSEQVLGSGVHVSMQRSAWVAQSNAGSVSISLMACR